MREIGLVATPNFQGAYVTASEQVHVLLRLKGLRKVSRPDIHAHRGTVLLEPAHDHLGARSAFAEGAAALGQVVPSHSAH